MLSGISGWLPVISSVALVTLVALPELSGFCHIKKTEFGSEVSDGGLGRCMYAWKNPENVPTVD